MKKIILSLFAVLSIAASSSAQVEMYVDGGTTNYAGGGVFSVTAVNGNELIHEIHVENHSNVSKILGLAKKSIILLNPLKLLTNSKYNSKHVSKQAN